MTLDKAIEILGAIRRAVYTYDEKEEAAAVKLSIEALKRFKELREVIRVPYTSLLPGEDPE